MHKFILDIEWPSIIHTNPLKHRVRSSTLNGKLSQHLRLGFAALRRQTVHARVIEQTILRQPMMYRRQREEVRSVGPACSKRHGCGGHGRPKAGRRQQRGPQRNQNVRSDHEQQERSNQGGSSTDMPNSSQAMPSVTPNPHPKVPIPGKRRVWGTMKSCGAQAVKNTISRLTSLPDQISVKRKFKKVGSRTRWWHVITAAETELKTLEAEWSSVQLQTS